MPGDRINDKQVIRYMNLRRTQPREVAAAKVGSSLDAKAGEIVAHALTDKDAGG